MHKKFNGYFTIEASFILPVVLFLYFLIIFSALFLYCRCTISQDNFLLAMRAGKFTWGEDYYGEVIYGSEQEKLWQAENYVQDRLARKREFYPVYPAQGGECVISKESVVVQTGQRGSRNRIVKSVQKLNPVEIIREGRKDYNA